MMKTLSWLSALVLLLGAKAVEAQTKPALLWRQGQAFSFGHIQEEGGPVIHRFFAINQSREPVNITSASASCGCTTPSWYQGIIQPGDSGYVEARFDPKGRVGAFRKTVTVGATSSPSAYELIISGEVKGRKITPRDLNPDTLGAGLRVQSRYQGITVEPNAKGRLVLSILNDGPAPATLKLAKGVPKFINLKLTPSPIQPGRTGELEIIYDAAKAKTLGGNTDVLKVEAKSTYKTTSTLILTTQVEKAPQAIAAGDSAKGARLVCKKSQALAGTYAQGRMIHHTFEIENTGGQPATLYGLKPGCGCMEAELTASILAPGQKAKVVVHVDTRGMQGLTTKSITLYSDEPAHPVLPLSITAEIVLPRGRKAQPAVE